MSLKWHSITNGLLMFHDGSERIGNVVDFITFLAWARVTFQRPSANPMAGRDGHAMTRHRSQAMALNVKIETSPKKPTPIPYSSQPAWLSIIWFYLSKWSHFLVEQNIYLNDRRPIDRESLNRPPENEEMMLPSHLRPNSWWMYWLVVNEAF